MHGAAGNELIKLISSKIQAGSGDYELQFPVDSRELRENPKP